MKAINGGRDREAQHSLDADLAPLLTVQRIDGYPERDEVHALEYACDEKSPSRSFCSEALADMRRRFLSATIAKIDRRLLSLLHAMRIRSATTAPAGA